MHAPSDVSPSTLRSASRPLRYHAVFHYVILPLLFVASLIVIVGLASIYLSPLYHEGNPLTEAIAYMPIAGGTLAFFALLCLISFVGLFIWHRWCLVILIVMLVMLLAIGVLVAIGAWMFLSNFDGFFSYASPALEPTVRGLLIGGCAAALLAVLTLVYYARRYGHFTVRKDRLPS